MLQAKRAYALYLRTAAFILAATALILTSIDPARFRLAVSMIHALLWLYAVLSVSIKLFSRPTRPLDTTNETAHSASGVIAVSIIIWITLLLAGYAVFMLLPFSSLSLLVAAVAFLGLLEIFFISSWCPFARLITHARCCNSCRLKRWGEAMVLSPLAAMPSWWSMALIALALALLIKYEILYKIYPCSSPQHTACKNCPEQCGAGNNKEP